MTDARNSKPPSISMGETFTCAHSPGYDYGFCCGERSCRSLRDSGFSAALEHPGRHGFCFFRVRASSRDPLGQEATWCEISISTNTTWIGIDICGHL